MLHTLANWLNEHGREQSDAGRKDRAAWLYKLASYADRRWSVPWYNLGLNAKYSSSWRDSLRFNQRAVQLNPQDEGGWWNLGIAATALHDWAEARRAWRAYGIDIPDGDGEVTMPSVDACVRLDPEGHGEVVWGERIDPARFVVLNVPLPESKHRFRDIVLNDGASNGKRERDGAAVPVFDELAVWRKSSYSTFRASIDVPDETAKEQLIEACKKSGIGIEDWGTIRILCAECSRGNPGPHECKEGSDTGLRSFAFAALSEDALRRVLDRWVSRFPEAAYSDVEIALAADA